MGSCEQNQLGDDLRPEVLNGGVNDLGGTLMEETGDNGSYKTISDFWNIL